MNLKLNEWYRIKEKDTGCFESVDQVIGFDFDEEQVLLSNSNGTRRALYRAQWDFQEIDAVEKALADIGLSNVATTMDRDIVTKMIDVGYRK